MDITMIMTPILGGVIGYTTNWLAIKMLFKPHREVRIGKLKVPFTPGLIPREKQRIANKLGIAVGQHLLTEDVIVTELTNDQVIMLFKNYIIQDLMAKPLCIDEILDHIYKDPKEKDALYDAIATWIQKKAVEEIRTNAKIEQQLFAFMVRKAPITETLGCILGETAQEQIKIFVTSQKEAIAQGIVNILHEEQVEEKVKNMIGEILAEKLGGFATMFVNPESLYTTIVTHTERYFEDEENQDEVVALICKKIDNIVEKELSEFIDTPSYIQGTETIVKTIQKECIDGLGANRVVDGIKQELKKMTKETIELSDETKERVAIGVCEGYKTFATQQFPALIQKFNVPRILENEVNRLSVEDVETLILSIVERELKAITWCGAVLGFLMGLIMLVI